MRRNASRCVRIFVASLCLVAAAASGQQVADTAFSPKVSPAAFAKGAGPRVAVDEAHFNFHTADGRYAPFAELLRRDGFVVTPLRDKFDAASLAGVDVLVIANALHERNVEEWALPTPSAFEPDEIAAVREWVQDGGALLLIADHMPFGGAAAELGGAFGLSFSNGYASEPTPSRGNFVFKRSDGSLQDHPIVRGRNAEEVVASVMTFTGQAFGAPGGQSLFVLPEQAFLWMPTAAGEITADTPRSPAGGLLQAATLSIGRGRVAAFGEAAMFSAQLAGPQRSPMGMNSPGAEQNAQFVLNVLHWLVGLLPG
jgi:hypothetical protein